VLQAEVEQEQAQVSLLLAEQDLRATWRMLAAVAGKPDLPLAPLNGDLESIPDLNYEEWLSTTLRESPEFKLAQQAIERAEATLAQSQKVYIPDLQVSANITQNNAPLMEINPLRATGLMGGAQVGVQLPLFNRNQGGVQAARAELESAQSDLARTRLQIGRALAGFFRDYEAARITVEHYRTGMLPKAEQAYKLYQANYQVMAAAYPQVLIAQRTFFQFQADYIQALERAWQSSLAIRGFGLMDGLSEPISPSVR
jgi:cobalt-zinc-cadmium efflux system outer membrane protein